MCDTKAYLYGSGLCVSSCPYGFMEEPKYHLCHLATEELTKPVMMLNYLNMNCTSSEYTVGSSGVCSSCHSSCQTCSGGKDTQCTSCSIGKYLLNGRCTACDTQGMVHGSSG